MLYAGDLLAVFVLVGFRWLVLDKLRADLWMLSLAQSGEVWSAMTEPRNPHSLARAPRHSLCACLSLLQ